MSARIIVTYTIAPRELRSYAEDLRNDMLADNEPVPTDIGEIESELLDEWAKELVAAWPPFRPFAEIATTIEAS